MRNQAKKIENVPLVEFKYVFTCMLGKSYYR